MCANAAPHAATTHACMHARPARSPTPHVARTRVWACARHRQSPCFSSQIVSLAFAVPTARTSPKPSCNHGRAVSPSYGHTGAPACPRARWLAALPLRFWAPLWPRQSRLTGARRCLGEPPSPCTVAPLSSTRHCSPCRGLEPRRAPSPISPSTAVSCPRRPPRWALSSFFSLPSLCSSWRGCSCPPVWLGSGMANAASAQLLSVPSAAPAHNPRMLLAVPRYCYLARRVLVKSRSYGYCACHRRCLRIVLTLFRACRARSARIS
jgi:hypothetical protein